MSRLQELLDANAIERRDYPDSEVHDLEAGVSRRDVWVLVDEVERLRRIVADLGLWSLVEVEP